MKTCYNKKSVERLLTRIGEKLGTVLMREDFERYHSVLAHLEDCEIKDALLWIVDNVKKPAPMPSPTDVLRHVI